MNPPYCSQCGASLIQQAQVCSACGAKITPVSSVVKYGKQPSKIHTDKRLRVFISLVFGGILLINAALFFLAEQSTPSVADISDSQNEQGILYPEVPRLSLEEAKVRYDAGTAIFLDVRAKEDYEAAHIPNALSLPLAELEARYQELPLDVEILTYCT